MSLRANAAAEFKRGPLTIALTTAGVVLAALALLVAWLQYTHGSASAAATTSVAPVSGSKLIVGNVLLALSFFLAASLSLASVVRLLARSHPFPALVTSVLAATLSIFGTLVVVVLAPPRHMSADASTAAGDAIYYGTIMVFIAINGLPVARSLIAPLAKPDRADAPKEDGSSDTTEGFAALCMVALALLIWGALVGAGQALLVRTFLA